MVVALSILKYYLFTVIGKGGALFLLLFINFKGEDFKGLNTCVYQTHTVTSEGRFVRPRLSAVQIGVSWYQNKSEAPHALIMSLASLVHLLSETLA